MADQSADDDILHELSDGVAWITLNRPDKGNALTPDQRDRLIDLLAEASETLTTRAVVLRGTGRHFCTGADLSVPRPPPARPDGAPERAVGDASRMIASGAQRLIAAVLDCEKPVLASLNGTAAGIGAHLALAADLVLAAASARLIEVFARRALVPDGGGAYLLTRALGPHRAKELAFFADDLPADEAERLGLYNRVVPDEELAAVTAEWAARLGAAPTRVLSLTKQLMNRAADQTRVDAFAEEALAVEVAMGTHDMAEGMRAFAERRDPDFTGW
jgi:2-(1,2-epoxy-1,2-dihydrophenyl)acetyl-CoA isomerase